MVAVVAEPDEKASAYFACSRAATACSKLSLRNVRAYSFARSSQLCLRAVTYRFGFELLVYS
jgi:hypothetical protein